MISVEREVRRLIAEMKAKAQEAGDPDKERETDEIQTIVMANSLIPEISDEAPASLISAYAQSALQRAWIEYAQKQLAAIR